MAEDGAIEMPTLSEMATCMKAIKSGGIKGLRVLGLLGAEDNTAEGIQTGLRTWMDLCERYFTSEQLRAFGWNILMAENSLCKIKRMEDFIVSLTLDWL